MKVKPGDLVYRVCAYEPHENETDQSVWRVQARAIKTAKTRIVLKQPFPGLWHIQFKEDALNRIFFLSPADALVAFADYQRKEIDAIKRHEKEALAAIDWAQAEISK